MCGRYITPNEAAIEREWSLVPRDSQYFQSFNLAPTQLAPVIIDADADPARAKGRERTLELFRWGFQPGWAKRSWINARAETVFESRAFKSAAAKRRCLVLAAGWYEWTGDRAPKQPYLFRRRDGRPFAFAGIWTQNDGGASFAILTTAADKVSAPIHDRMPLILHPLAYAAWLWPQSLSKDYRAVIEHPGDDAEYEVFPVSKAVNSPRNNAPELIERIQ